METDGAEIAYLRAVEQRFRELRESPLLLSPADFRLAQSWFERGVPLWLVLETISDMYARARAAGRSGPRTLRYCRRAVDEAFAAWTAAQEGRGERQPGEPDGVPRENVVARARTALEASRVPEPVREEIVAALVSLPDTAEGWRELDDRLIRLCLDSLAPDERRGIETRAEALVAPYREAMREDVHERARRAAVKRLVRERFRIPDMTLLPLF